MKEEHEQENNNSKGKLLLESTENSQSPTSINQHIGKATNHRQRLDDPKVWRWVVLAGFFVSAFFLGIDRSMSIFYVEMMEHFDTDNSVMSSIGSIFYAFYCFSGIITMPITNVLGTRVMVIVGGLFCFVGLMTSAFAHNVYLCIACFGFFLGSGSSLVYLNASAAVMFYFNKKRAVAQAIVLGGYASGGMIIPIILQYLNEKYNWRGALIIFSGAVLNICACGALIRSTPEENKAKIYEGKRKIHHALFLAIKELFTSRPVVLIWIHSTFFHVALSIMAVHMKPTLMHNTDASDAMGSYVISFSGAAYCLGFFLSGFVAHVTNIEHIVLLESGTFLCGLCMILIPAFETLPLIVTLICLFTFFAAVNGTFLPIVLCDYVGTENLRIAWAIRYAFAGIGALAGPAVAGLLVDKTHSYSNSMLLGGSASIFSVIVMIEPCISTYRKSRVKTKVVLGAEKKEEMWKSISSLPCSTVGF